MASGPFASCPIHRHAQARPDALALWTPDRRWSYSELDAAIAATCARLREQGIVGERRVALCLHRGADLVLLLWALWRAGGVAMPLSTRWPAPKVREAVRRMGARWLITRDRTLLDDASADFTVCPPDQVALREGKGEPAPARQSIHRRATLVFTSGTTGISKAVLHSWANYLYSAKGSNANLPLRPGDRWVLSLPLYHVGGLAILVRCALAGAAVTVPDRNASVATMLDSTGTTHASLVATQLRRLLDAQDGSVSPQLRGLLLGGGPLPETLLRRGHTRDWPLHTSYGSTEMASQVTTTPPGAPLGDLQTAGRCLPHRRVRIDADGQILVAGPTLCLAVTDGESIGDPRVDGWFPTGDLGLLDASGRLHVEGRTDRQFVSGGENIQPEEIEAALERVEGVDRAVVVPVPDEEYGHRPVAFVQSGTGTMPDDWQASLATTLPRFKVPETVYELPDSAIRDRMKVDHDLLRRRAQEKFSTRGNA